MAALEVFPRVLLKDGTLSYGGSQNWFRDFWRRLSGCASVCATNMAAYYTIGMKPDLKEFAPAPVFSQALYRKQMNLMFRDHMTSGRMGFPDPNRYAEEFVRYAARFQTTAIPETQFERTEAEEAYDLILRRLDNGDPVALLILQHTAKALDDITWHWMTVTGLDTETDTLVVSNYGKRETWPASVVFETKVGNQTYLIAFDIKN